ncbi:MAG: Asp-tRNA(Asn)/Glu-tRNA(Gln) amidotransferase subunit GatB [Actinomycetota bacterium]
MNYEAVIGLECHVELNTESKMFCGCPTTFGGEPNTRTCPVCLGEPGSLPVPNRRAVESTMMIGLALGCRVAPHSLFHRKNYFYPDMPKNYQISQYDLPLCIGGRLDVEVAGTKTTVGITRVHLEEDTGKSLHIGTTGRISEAKYSLVDYNRAGIPLVEVVSEPDIRSAAEAQRYVAELRSILEALGVSDVRMEEGSMRCDANISMREPGGEFGTKVEIKNLNSIRSVGRALTFEIERQRKALEAGQALLQETRHFDESSGVTKTLRSKEEAFDYRYFPEPDLLPISATADWVSALESSLPELPQARRARLAAEHGLSVEQAHAVGASVASTGYFEGTVAAGPNGRDAAVWMAGELGRALNNAGVGIQDARVSPAQLADLIRLVGAETVNLNTAKRVFQMAFESGDDPGVIIGREGMAQVSDEGALATAIAAVVASNATEVERFRAGEEKVFGFLVGQVMRETKGKANPALVNDLLRKVLTTGGA